MSRNVVIFAGTRPEAIKLAPVFFRLRERGCDVAVIASGQHADLALPIWDEFGIVPTDIWIRQKHLTSASDFAADATDKLRGKLVDHQVDYVVVQGDTSTAFAGAWAAFQQGVPVGHVEAGIRSGNWMAPWPEELIRRGIATIARHHFAPTKEAAEALKRENAGGEIFVTGNTVIDAVSEITSWRTVKRIGNRVLMTIHRHENQVDHCRAISTLLRNHTRAFPDFEFHLIRHPNPNLNPLYRTASELPNVVLRDPVGYRQFLEEIATAKLVMTDSGGVQEEASFIGTPVVVLRDHPDRFALPKHVVGTDVENARKAFSELISAPPPSRSNRYGDGRAAQRIAETISEFLRPPL